MRKLQSEIFEQFGAQLGELVWHSQTLDKTIDNMTQTHFQSISPLVTKFGTKRFIEVASYAHYTGNMLPCEGFLCDISPHTLRLGEEYARRAGVTPKAVLVATDFHKLPFADASFDFVYVASAIHHTRRPKDLLAECLRVLSDKGILLLENEPCMRTFAFERFRGNRHDAMLPIEKAIEERGIYRLITCYLGHSRPEMVFNMIENANIPVRDYLDILEQHEIIALRLNWKGSLGSFDSMAIDAAEKSSSSVELAKSLADLIGKRIEGLAVSEQEAALGFSLPDADAISDLCRRVAPALRWAARNGKPDEAMANVFGAALRAVIRKRGGAPLQAEARPIDCALVQGVWQRPLLNEHCEIRTDRLLFPELHHADERALGEFFSPSDWSIEKTANGGKAGVMRRPSARIQAPLAASAVFLLRLYAPCPGGSPYKISVTDKQGSLLADEIVVAQNETRVIRFVGENVGAFWLNSTTMDGTPLLRAIRVPVVQGVPLELRA